LFSLLDKKDKHLMGQHCLICPLKVNTELKDVAFSIQKVPGSKSSLETSYPESHISWFLSAPPGKYWDSNLNIAIITSVHIYSNSLFTNHPDSELLITLVNRP
jgi:hypothetical protein